MADTIEPLSPYGIDLDPVAAERRKADRLRRLNVVLTPMMRAFGFGWFVLAILIHNTFYLGDLHWRQIGIYAAIGAAYSLVSWLVLYSFYRPDSRLNLATAFLALDPFIWTIGLYHSGREKSLLFFVMLLRVADQASTNFRRAMLFAHTCTLAYAVLPLYLVFVEQHQVSVGSELAKILFIYMASIYISLSGRTAELLRSQTTAAIRVARESIIRLKEAMAAAEESRQRAEEANKAKSVFLANMSHELRTPLNAILGFVQLMQRDRSLRSEQRENLDIITRSGEYLLALINDVLSISKIEAGRHTLNEQVFDLRRLLLGLEEMVRNRAQAKRLQFISDISPELPRYVRGDEGKLRQVLINLLGNAVKFTDSGGLSMRARWHGGVAHFEVEDTGHGIDVGELPQVFEAFAQTESGRKSVEGTGLGLAISRHFVQMMGGDIRVKSELGTGTLFSFDINLPVAMWVDEEAEPQKVIGLEPGQPDYRILVVDDVWENRVLLVRLLESVGLNTIEAANGREAVDLWRSLHPQLVFMDMRMPVMDGYEATREIRQLERLSRRQDGSSPEPTVIVALTASAFEHDRDAIIEAGCDDFVPKPYRESTIFQRLSAHLGIRFRLEDAPSASPRAPTSASIEIPREFVEELRTAVTAGDVVEAVGIVERIAHVDAAAAAELRRLLRSYRFEELQVRLDRAEQEAADT